MCGFLGGKFPGAEEPAGGSLSEFLTTDFLVSKTVSCLIVINTCGFYPISNSDLHSHLGWMTTALAQQEPVGCCLL